MKALVIKFFTGNISNKELEALKKWLRKPKNQRYFNEMIKANQRLDLAYRPIDVEKAYQQIVEETNEAQDTSYKAYRTIFKYAAVAMVLIATSSAVYTYVNTNQPTDELVVPKTNSDSQITLELGDGTLKALDEGRRTTIVNGNGGAVAKQEYDRLTYDTAKASEIGPVYNRLAVPYGKRFSVELSDGTIVHLNAGTKLRYPEVFTGLKSREVYLEGEAFFSVAENASHPFIVHTEKMDVRVFGTKFNVSSYVNEEITSTVLVEGSVGVYGPEEDYKNARGTIISPNQQAIIHNGTSTVHEVDVQKFIAWIDGTLYFDNDRFGDIIKELERHYNVKIVNNYRELGNVRYTGAFQSKTIHEIFNVFKRNTKFEYRMEDDDIVIEPSFSKEVQ